MRAEKVCLLHVGTHKTGTTSFQTLCATHRVQLLEAGILYPEATSRSREPGHHNLAAELGGYQDLIPEYGTLDHLIDEVRTIGPDKVLISSENLQHLYDRPEALIRLRDVWMSLGYTPHIAIAFRSVADYQESLFIELCKWHSGLTRAEFDQQIAEHGSFTSSSGRRFSMDYPLIVESFAAVFGDAQVHAVDYVRSNMSFRFASELSWFFGDATALFSNDMQLNNRIDQVGWLQARLNAIYASRTWELTRPLRLGGDLARRRRRHQGAR